MAGEELHLEGTPLSSLFEKADRLYSTTADDDTSGSDGKLKDCAVLLEECSKRVRQLALFSPNEELDDVSTMNIKYLLVPYMQADVAYRLPALQRHDASAAEKQEGAEDLRFPFSAPSPDEMASSRLKVLGGVLQHLEGFLGACDRLQLVSKEERIALLGSLDATEALDPATKRAVKVARFKKEKELKLKLEALKARRAAAKRISLRRGTEGKQLPGAGSSVQVTGMEAAEQEPLEDSFVEEAEERQLWIAELQSAWVKATDLEQTVKREQEMLLSAQEASGGQGLRSVAGQPLTREQLDRNLKEREASHRRAAAAAASELRAGVVGPSPATITCATLAQDVIEGRAGPSQVASHKHTPIPLTFGPVSLMGGASPHMNGGASANGSLTALTARQAAAARVFQPSHSLPQMSIEEAGLREMRMMQQFQDSVKKGMEDQGYYVKDKKSDIGLENGPPPDEESEDEDEKESNGAVMKARAWDDWKDENPRGKGNSKLTPCG